MPVPYKHVYPFADGQTVVTNGVARIPYPVITADGNYPGADGVLYGGGTGTFEIFGTLGAGTYKLQMRGIDGVTWLDLGSSLTLTAQGVVGFVAPNRQLRLNVSGSTGASVYSAISKVVGD